MRDFYSEKYYGEHSIIIGFDTVITCADYGGNVSNFTTPYFTIFALDENGGKFIMSSFNYGVQGWNGNSIGGSFGGTISFSDIDFELTNNDTWNLAFTLNISHSSWASGGNGSWSGSAEDSYSIQINSYNKNITYSGNGQGTSYRCRGKDKSIYGDNYVKVDLSNASVY